MNEPTGARPIDRLTTGHAAVDAILHGGFPTNSLNVLMGAPGTGKTILAEQMMFHNASEDCRALYLTTLSEPLSKVVTYLQGFAFYDADRLGSAVVYDDVGAAFAAEGPGVLVPRLREAIRTMSPRLIVIDSFRALHDLGAPQSDMRRLISEMAGLLSAYRVTTFLVGEYTEDDMSSCPEFAVADSIVQLARRGTPRRDERFLRVFKLRGSAYAEGLHSFEITPHGLEVHPRLVTPRVPVDYVPEPRRIASGVPGLDELLDGGVWAGSSTLITGAAGTGKTTLALQFAMEGARNGERCLFLNLQENPVQLARTLRSLGSDADQLRAEGLDLVYHSPVELRIDRVASDILDRVNAGRLHRIAIDALGDLVLAAGDRERFHDFLYSIVQHLIVNGVTSFLTLEREPRREMDGYISSISDAVIELGLDMGDPPRRTIRVVKARGAAHDLRRHELVLGMGGASIPEVVA